MSADEYADRLATIACQLVARVRTDGADDSGHWLRHVAPTERERFDLLFVLAAAVPDDRSWPELTAWAAVEPMHPLVAERFGLTPAA